MNKENLIQIHHKRKEVRDLQKMIKKTDEDIYRLNENAESDTVTGSRPDLTIGPIKITGIPEGTICDVLKSIYLYEKHAVECEDDFIAFLLNHGVTHKEANESLRIPLRKIQTLSKS